MISEWLELFGRWEYAYVMFICGCCGIGNYGYITLNRDKSCSFNFDSVKTVRVTDEESFF